MLVGTPLFLSATAVAWAPSAASAASVYMLSNNIINALSNNSNNNMYIGVNDDMDDVLFYNLITTLSNSSILQLTTGHRAPFINNVNINTNDSNSSDNSDESDLNELEWNARLHLNQYLYSW